MADVKQGDGWIAFAVILGFMAGTWNALQGFISLLFKEAAPSGGLVFLTLQQWGFMLIIFGVLQVVAAFMVSGRKNSAGSSPSFLRHWVSWPGRPTSGSYRSVGSQRLF